MLVSTWNECANNCVQFWLLSPNCLFMFFFFILTFCCFQRWRKIIWVFRKQQHFCNLWKLRILILLFQYMILIGINIECLYGWICRFMQISLAFKTIIMHILISMKYSWSVYYSWPVSDGVTHLETHWLWFSGCNRVRGAAQKSDMFKIW